MKTTISILTTILLSFFLFSAGFAQKKEEKLQNLPHSEGRCDVLNDIAARYLQQDARKALMFAQEAFNMADSLNYAIGKAKALRNQGSVFFIQQDFRSSLDAHIKALAIYEEKKDSLEITLTLINIANANRKLKNFTSALELYEKASIYLAEKKDTTRLIVNWINLGLCDFELEKYDGALQYFQRSLDFSNKYAIKENLPTIFRSIGSVYEKQLLYEKALVNYREAYQIDEEQSNKHGMAKSLNAIGRLHLKMEKYLEAYNVISKSLSISSEVGDLGLVMDNHQGLSEFYEAVDEYKKALDEQKIFKKLSDSLKEAQQGDMIAAMQDRFFSERKDKEIALLNQKRFLQDQNKQRQNIIIVSLIAVVLIIVIVLFLLYKNTRTKQRINYVLSMQKEVIQKKNEAIMASITYAQRIQSAIPPAEKKIEEILGEFFVLFKPKDIVSGDFYWVAQTGSFIVVTAVDCTGHGVPGAFMSMIGGSLLRQIIMEKGITNPAEILMRMDLGVRRFLRQEETQNRDGMDMAICVIDRDNNELHFSGAKNPCVYIQHGKVEEVKGSKQSVGGAASKKVNDPYRTHTIPLEKGTFVYLLSDGFQDQFGGEENKKYGFSNLKRYLASVSHLPAREQKTELEANFEGWKGNQKQIDDVLVFGFRV